MADQLPDDVKTAMADLAQHASELALKSITTQIELGAMIYPHAADTVISKVVRDLIAVLAFSAVKHGRTKEQTWEMARSNDAVLFAGLVCSVPNGTLSPVDWAHLQFEKLQGYPFAPASGGYERRAI